MQLNPFSSNFPFSKFKLNFYPTYLLQEKYTCTHTHTHMHKECSPFLDSPIEYSPLQAQQLWLHLVRVPTRLARPEALAVRRIRWGRGLKVYATPFPQADTALHTRTHTHKHTYARTHRKRGRESKWVRERDREGKTDAATISQFCILLRFVEDFCFGFWFCWQC